MSENILSKNSIAIRLPDERWDHIVEEHGELQELRLLVLQTMQEPDKIVAGNAGEMLAVKQIEPRRWMIVVYRELNDDGFIITAFMTSCEQSFAKRRVVWPR